MTKLFFYEKPGCVGNQQQKAELRKRGIRLQVRDLLSQPWTPDTLRPFFDGTPVPEWFNLSAPAVKSGEVDINACDADEALQLMLADPLLIRRPLLELDAERQSGYVEGPVFRSLGITLNPGQDLQSCPMNDAPDECPGPTGSPS